MKFGIRNSNKKSKIFITICFILLSLLIFINIDNIKAYSDDSNRLNSLIDLCIEDKIKELSEEEKNKIKLHVDKVIDKRDNKSILGKSHFILGNIYYNEDKYKISIDEYNKASEYFEKVNNNMILTSFHYYLLFQNIHLPYHIHLYLTYNYFHHST